MAERTDILISGGGVAGLIAAAAFGAMGFDVICVDPHPPITDGDDAGADLRTTAFLQPSKTILEEAGVWDKLAGECTDLQVMQIIDAGGEDPVARVTKAFDAADISDAPFGWNFRNWMLRRELLVRLAELPNVSFRPGVGFASVLTREGEARVRLSDGTSVSARLLIGADGRNSPVRNALGIGVTTLRYGQKALTFAVTHPEPHQNVSTEVHRSGGPFTLVPLPDLDGAPRSAVVWMERGPEAERLQTLPMADFETAATARSTGLLGPLTLVTRRTVWPIISQFADRLTGERTALMAEAAHVVPPIGAQGLNMSLRDLRVLLDLAKASPDTLGDRAMLDAYARARAADIHLRVAGIDALNRTSMAGAPVLRDLRAKGLDLIYGIKPVRRTMMKLGLGVRGAA